MFIKKLIIEKPTEIIREIDFCSGLNLIIDDTPFENTKSTGNNVGKTTVLKLIDFCLGAKGKIIYTDTENKNEEYDIVKNFLVDEEIEVKLILTENLNDPNAKILKIQRNFLQGKKAIRKINGNSILEKDFEKELEKKIMPNKEVEKPTFRQIISHNIRYKDDSINNTLKTLDKFTTDIEYETLYLYLLGCSFDEGAKKQALISKINQEIIFKERLEKKQTKTTYEIALDMVNDEINLLNERKISFNLNETLEEDLEQLNIVRYNINKTSSLISKLEIRKGLIEDLVEYHNNMIVEKAKYIAKDLPGLLAKLAILQNELTVLLKQEKELTERIAKGDSFEELEKVIFELNEKYRIKGEYESVISQLEEVEGNISILNEQIESIDSYLFSGDFEALLKEQLKKFNKIFSAISQVLEPGGIDHLESDRNSQFELNRNSQCTLAN